MKHFTIIYYFVFLSCSMHSQSFVSVTIDDVPNTGKYQTDNYQSKLLNKLDSLDIPVTIFINEGLIYLTDSVSKNFNLLNNWIQKDYVTPGNHTFSHSRYSDVGLALFKEDIEKGESITRELAKKYNKSLRYFRFPYNDLGKDSLQHNQINEYLAAKGYIKMPFTVESSDWMYNSVYEYYLNKLEYAKAAAIAKDYIAKTLAYFDFYDSLTIKIYGRKVNHIYLCLDNSINADYLPVLVEQLRKKDYTFIGVDEAMQDDIYEQTDNYYKKWGISWLYRWMNNQQEISSFMKTEPSTEEIEKLYEQLNKDNTYSK